MELGGFCSLLRVSAPQGAGKAAALTTNEWDDTSCTTRDVESDDN